jgi:hypothetical protein
MADEYDSVAAHVSIIDDDFFVKYDSEGLLTFTDFESVRVCLSSFAKRILDLGYSLTAEQHCPPG